MEKLGAGDYIILVLSESYFKSKYCMFELLTINEHKQFHQRVFPIVLQGLHISEAETKIDYLNYWDDKIKNLEEKMKKSSQANRTSINEDLNLYMGIRHGCDHLMAILGDMNALTEEIHLDTDFEVLINSIFSELEKDENKKQEQREEARNKFRGKMKYEINKLFNK